MALLTVELPKPVLDSLKRKARAGRRGVADQLVETLTTALDQKLTTPCEFEASLDGMQFLTDQELVKATKPTAARKIARELSTLRDIGRARRLTKEERHRQQVLLDSLDSFNLVRAQSLVLLQQRGRDVSDLLRV
ncbi:MAG: hypothetical protein ACKV2Q_28935 [Planctomycetaceae bacterium]